MKISSVAEETDHSVSSFFDSPEFAAMTVDESTTALTGKTPQESEVLLDTFVTVVKWIFLYLPGATAIHLIMMGIALLYFIRIGRWRSSQGRSGSLRLQRSW